jgi:hypothetical protein
MSAHAFEFTPMGIVPLGTQVPVDATAPAPAVARPRAAPLDAPAPLAQTASGFDPASVASALQRALAMCLPGALPAQPVLEEPALGRLMSKPITGRELLAAARRRLRELDRDVPRLVKERDELRRLVGAATKRPKKIAQVVHLKASPTE